MSQNQSITKRGLVVGEAKGGITRFTTRACGLFMNFENVLFSVKSENCGKLGKPLSLIHNKEHDQSGQEMRVETETGSVFVVFYMCECEIYESVESHPNNQQHTFVILILFNIQLIVGFSLFCQ